MAKFNTKVKDIDASVNYEGDKGYRLNPKMDLYSRVCVSALEGKYYESATDNAKSIMKLMEKVNPKFIAKLAIYARTKMYLRSIPVFLTAYLAKLHNGDNLIRKMSDGIIQRADEITELLSCYQSLNEDNWTESEDGQNKKLCKLSKQLQLGLADSFHKFDEYQFAKYNRDNEVKLRDALFLSHPKPSDKKEKELFKKIAEDTLETPYTWEVELSKIGQDIKDKDKKQKVFRDKWEELIDSNRLGYMALLRNLRNILDVKVSKEYIIKIAETLSDKEKVLKSRQLPFRFLSAYRMLKENDNPYTSIILDSLDKAIKHSSYNIEGYGYDTTVLIASDVSGSMRMPISQRSIIQYYDIGLLLGMILQHKCKSVINGIFGDTWLVNQLPKSNILQNADELYKLANKVGFTTNGWRVLKYLLDEDIKVDKLMFFTDMQMWDSSTFAIKGKFDKLWKEYRKNYPESKMYIFDLSGYGNSPVRINEDNTFLISGWSDKIFDVLKGIEEGKSALDEIEKIEL